MKPSSSKSRTQILADKAAGWLFYIALAVAALTAVAWTVAIGFNVDVIARVATVLVIACPHALGLAIPLVVAITTAMGANNGILVRDRLALEEARDIDTIIFDKTGTLTEASLAWSASRPLAGLGRRPKPWRWPPPSKAIRSIPSRGASAAAPRSASWPCRK